MPDSYSGGFYRDADGALVVVGKDGTAVSAPRVVDGGQLPAAYDFDMEGDQEVWLIAELVADTEITVLNDVDGATFRLLLVQDTTGGRALTVGDGTTSLALSVPVEPGDAVAVTGYSDGETIYLDVAAGSGGGGAETDPVAVAALAAHEADTTSIHGITDTADLLSKTLVDAKGDLLVATAADTIDRLAAGTDGYSLVADDAQATKLKYAPRTQFQAFTKTGAVATVAGATRFRFPHAAVIESVAATVGTAPTGAALIVDVHLNGTTIFTTQADRPEIAISGFASADEVPAVTAVAVGDYLTVDVDQVGSTIAGSDLVVVVRYRLAA